MHDTMKKNDNTINLSGWQFIMTEMNAFFVTGLLSVDFLLCFYITRLGEKRIPKVTLTILNGKTIGG